jgi:hypothetical protein
MMIDNSNYTTWKNEEKESINKIMQQQVGNFCVVKNGSQGDIFHWVDRRVNMLSSRKLWEILQLVESEDCEAEKALITDVRAELLSRHEAVDSNPWKRPH